MRLILFVSALLIAHPFASKSQTDMDAIMMNKKNLCIGPMYGYSSWKNYWEGTFKRDNQNIGTLSSQMVSVMGTYGIKNNLNVVVNIPYVWTNASRGTLHGMSGMQDLSLWLKWRPVSTGVGKGTFSLFGLGGTSFPTSNYTADFLPMSIGLQSTTFSGRIIADYLLNKFFVTASGTYTYRNNIKISRNSYYTTEMHYTNEVEMPDVASFNLRTGYRTGHLMIEAFALNMTTLGGFDIRKNDMPFPSNKMNATSVGAGFRYEIHRWSFMGDGSYVVAGRNVGQATSFSGGVFYLFDFAKKNKKN